MKKTAGRLLALLLSLVLVFSMCMTVSAEEPSEIQDEEIVLEDFFDDSNGV